MSLLHTIIAFIVALGLLIVVHEYGHYLIARLCGVKVLRFSVGFGRLIAIWRRGADQTEWVIAAIPFGGYVKMLDEREGPVEPSEAHRAFNRQSVWRRFAIVVAGPVANFLFAIAVYAGLFMYGLPEAKPVLGAPPEGTVAAVAGVRPGDTVRSVDGERITTWQELRWRVLQSALQREPLRLEAIDEKGHLRDATLDLRSFPADDVESDALERVGLRLYRPPLEPVIGQLVGGGAAERAGVAVGDRVLAADERPLESWEALVAAVQARPEVPLKLTIERNGARQTLTVVPASVAAGQKRIGRIGAAPAVPASHAERILIRVQHGPVDSLWRGVVKTADISVFSLKMLGKMLVGEVSWKHLSGPVTIADFAGQSAQMGWVSYVTFLALISI
ncbi:MAG: RIP metalloprotease RseP, partial [Burkholderiales bacterium]